MHKKRIIKGSKHKDSQTRKSEILQAAMQAFSDHGYQKTSIDQIAKMVNLSKGSIYRHFKNKEAIILAINDFYMEEIEAMVLAKWANEPSHLKRIQIMMRSVHEFANEQVPLEHVWVEYLREDGARDKFAELIAYERQVIAEQLNLAYQNGEINKAPHQPMIDIIMSFAEGLVSMHEMDQDFNILERFDGAWPYIEGLIRNGDEINTK